VETRPERRDADLTPRRVVFAELRDDWYRGADLMARLLARTARGSEVTFVGFPRQWAPLFAHFGARTDGFIAPPAYVPIASDVSDASLSAMIDRARSEGRLRQLVEIVAAADPVVADVLYRLDRRVVDSNPVADPVIPFTGWQSYGRPELQRLARAVDALPRSGRPKAVVLPCARKRPYDRSKTHRRIWQALEARGIRRDDVDAIVVSSVGVVPEALWNDPVVLAYDSGVPDIYRVLRLMRAFFRGHPYKVVIDCLEFAPYSDCLSVVAREEFIGRVVDGPRGRTRKLGVP